MIKEQSQELKEQGYTIIRNQISSIWLELLSKGVDKTFIQYQQYPNNQEGVALHAILGDSIFFQFLQVLLDDGFVESLKINFFKSPCILNSFSALNNIPNQPNFSSKPHRDLRFYSGDFNMMLNCLIMVDDFTVDNGGTFILPNSHKIEDYHGDDYFFENCKQITGNKGDILIFNANTFHASAPNNTKGDRRAIPFTLSRSCMKQLLDYPRAIGYERMNEFPEELQQLLGYHSRVPASLDEWYQPEENRFYKKSQD